MPAFRGSPDILGWVGLMTEKHYIAVRNWDRHQHYKDRAPPWIKLYTDILTHPIWVAGTDASKALAVAIMLLASRNNNKIPLNLAYIRAAAHLNSDPDINFLVEQQFIEIVDEKGASTVLAECYQDASVDAPRGEERRGEKRRGDIARGGARAKQKNSKPKRSRFVPDDWMPSDALLADLRAKHPRLDIEAQLAAMRDHEYDKPKSDWGRCLRTWCRNAETFGPAKKGNGGRAPQGVSLAPKLGLDLPQED